MSDRAEEQTSILLQHSETTMTGTVVCASVIAAGAGHTESIRDLEIAIIVTVTAYWLVHLYAATLAQVIRDRHHPLLAFRSALRHSWPSLAASLLPVGILLVADALGAELFSSALIALLATVGLLALYGAIAGHRAGLPAMGVVASGLLGACFGAALVVVYAAVH